MLKGSQPLDPKVYKKLGLNDSEREKMSARNIKSQHIGKMFDDFFDDSGKRKISAKKRLGWKLRRFKDAYYDCKHSIRNHVKWHKTLKNLRSWNGYDGLMQVMQTQLLDYITTEEKYGVAEEEYKKQKIATAKETVELLKRMAEPDNYIYRRRDEVEKKYPDYKSLITKYECGGGSSSGDFVAQGTGWVGKESGADPREGYFEFVNGRFELADSPDPAETERLLAELAEYHKEIGNVYAQATADSDEDFARLGQLLKENLYSWWD